MKVFVLRINSNTTHSGWAYLASFLWDGDEGKALYVSDPAKAMQFPSGQAARDWKNRDDMPAGLGNVVAVEV